MDLRATLQDLRKQYSHVTFYLKFGDAGTLLPLFETSKIFGMAVDSWYYSDQWDFYAAWMGETGSLSGFRVPCIKGNNGFVPGFIQMPEKVELLFK